MAQYTITHACGHEHTHQLYGKTAGRERKEQWLASGVCPACYKAEQEAKRQAANEAAQAANASAGLPALEGTPKQIAWAETIRAGYAEQIDQIKARLEAAGGLDKLRTQSPAEKVAAFERQLASMDALLAKVSAAWWIDHRQATLQTLVTEIAAEIA